MIDDAGKRRRRSIRLPAYDYRQSGAYFVTIRAHGGECLFGEIVGGEMRLDALGKIADECWNAIPVHFQHVELDRRVVMPNHLHGIVIIVGARHAVPVGARHAVPLRPQFGRPVSGSLPTVVRSFKSAVAKRINEMRGAPGAPVWQRNYYERVVRDEDELCRIREYIAQNPMQWELDRENPNRAAPPAGARHAALLQEEPWRVRPFPSSRGIPKNRNS